MKCTDVSELITAVLDGELSGKLRPSFDAHLKECAQCRNEFELSSLTKRLIRQRLKPVKVPMELAARITAQVRQEAYTVQRSNNWFTAKRFPFSWRPVAALSGAFALILMLMFLPSKKQHTHAQPDDANIIHQTYNNFDKFLEGSIVPTFSSNDPFAVRSFFAQNAHFTASIPRIKQCKLLGGMFSLYESEPIAHMMYEINGKPMYVYQIDLQRVLDNDCLKLPEVVKRELLLNGRYVQVHSANCTMVMWVEDSNLCCAVADIPKDDMLAYLEGK